MLNIRYMMICMSNLDRRYTLLQAHPNYTNRLLMCQKHALINKPYPLLMHIH